MSSPVLDAPNSEAKDAFTDPPVVDTQLEATLLLPEESNVISPVLLSIADIFHTPLALDISLVVGGLPVGVLSGISASRILSPTL